VRDLTRVREINKSKFQNHHQAISPATHPKKKYVVFIPSTSSPNPPSIELKRNKIIPGFKSQQVVKRKNKKISPPPSPTYANQNKTKPRALPQDESCRTNRWVFKTEENNKDREKIGKSETVEKERERERERERTDETQCTPK
jgi:hypothetical protein